MIISELVFFQVQREVFGVYPMAFGEHLLGEAPEALDAVDVGATVGEHLPMVDRKVFSKAVQVVVAHKVICVEDRSLDGMLPDLAHQGLLRTVGDGEGANPPFSL